MRIACLLLCWTVGCWAARGAPVDVLPVRVSEGAQSLNGGWAFKYLAGLDAGADERFCEPGFDAAGWKTIPVPSHWELQGFAEPQYADGVKEGLGLYRRTFRAPEAWRGQRVFLRFDGVLYGLAAWVNGKPVGEWGSSFNPVTFDVTDALAANGAENLLAVRVTTRNKGWNFDNMDCWALSGIYRDVTLFAQPQIHLKDYTARTALKPDGSAELHLDIVASAAARVSGRLLAPDGQPVKAFELALAEDGRGSAVLAVGRPQLWTAETPALYRLELELQSAGPAAQRFADRIGLRQVAVEDGVLKVNGTPVKLRGVDHHDLWPEAGRVATEERMRRDLALIRAANINFIRTSHYPPHPRFIELCDELGFYLDDEVPYIHGRKDLKKADFQEVLLARARATVLRDKNRPSVLFWSCGNENPITALGNRTGQYVKELDPTRPVTFPTMGSYFKENVQKFPEFMDLYASHYPSVKQAREYAKTLQRPIVFTEYAHQRGLARAGTGVQDLWELFYQSPRIAGGAVWVFQDQGLLRTAEDRARVPDADLMVWLDEQRYYDTRGFYAMDGLVYSDRTPQTDYWQVRKVYSPVQIPERALAVKPGAQTLTLTVENRFDFRTLEGVKLKWALRRNGASLQDGVAPLRAKAKATEAVALRATLPEDLSTDVFALELRCEDDGGRAFYERSIRLESGAAEDARWAALRAALPEAEASLEVTDSFIAVRHASYQLKLDRRSGQLALLSPGGGVIISAAGPHMGRNPTINDMGKAREREPELWRWGLLREARDVQAEAKQTPEGIRLTVSGTYPRPGKPGEALRGGYELLVARSGAIDVSYRYEPLQATGEVPEAGFALELPAAHAGFRWLGQGPYAGYPGKDRLNEYGLFHLGREDLYFPGNRREVELAAMTDPAGSGVLLAGGRMTLDLENVDGATRLSHLARVPGERSGGGKGENVDVSSRLKADDKAGFEGRFIVLPVSAPWPALLAKWFGAPGRPADVKRLYLSSYDR